MKKHPKDKYILFVCLIFFILFLYLITFQSLDLLYNSKFTVGKTIKIKGTGTRKELVYSYIVNDYEYIRACTFPDDIIVPNGLYFVAYSKNNPRNSVMLFRYHIADDSSYSEKVSKSKIDVYQLKVTLYDTFKIGVYPSYGVSEWFR